jgi:hypothetical protein
MSDELNTEEANLEVAPTQYRRKEQLPTDEELDAMEAAEFAEQSPKETEPEPDGPEEVTFKKRYGDLRNYHQSEVAKRDSEIQRLRAERDEARPEYVAPKTPEELEAFRKEYPDLMDTIATIARSQAVEADQSTTERLKNIEEREYEVKKRSANQSLRELHPDIEDIREDTNFHEWAKMQEPEIQGWLYDNDTNARLAARAIDMYKADTGIKTSKKSKSRASAADAVTKTTNTKTEGAEPKIWFESEITSLKPDEYERYEAEIDKAQAEGRVRRG